MHWEWGGGRAACDMSTSSAHKLCSLCTCLCWSLQTGLVIFGEQGLGYPKQLNGLLGRDVERNAQTGLSHHLSCGVEFCGSCFYWSLSDPADCCPGLADCCREMLSSSLTCLSSFVASSEGQRLIKENSCRLMANHCPSLLFTCTNYFDI